MKVKDTAKTTVDTTKRVVTNAEQLVQATALLVTAGFAYWALSQVQLNVLAQWAVTLSLVVIGLRGTYEFFKFLNK